MLKNSFIALQGTIIAQGIGFLVLPVLTRLYSPAAFGVYQLYASVLTLILVASALRYETALLRSDQVRAVLRLCLSLNLLTAILTLTASTVLVVWSPNWLHISDQVLWLLCASVLAGGIFRTFSYVLLREQALGISSFAKITQVSIFCLAGVVAAYAGYIQFGLLGADVIGRIATALLIFAWLFRHQPTFFGKTAMSEVIAVGREFRQYPIFSTAGGLLGASVATIVPILMLGAFGEAVMGQYALVMRAVLAPAGLIGQSVAQAFTAQISSSIVSGEDVLPAFRRVILIMAALALVPAIVLFFFGPQLVELIFGGQWALAGNMVPVVSILFLTSFAVAPVNMTLLIIGRQKQQLAWEIARLALIGVVWAIILLLSISPIHAIAIHASAMVVMYVIFVWLADRALRKQRDENAA